MHVNTYFKAYNTVSSGIKGSKYSQCHEEPDSKSNGHWITCVHGLEKSDSGISSDKKLNIINDIYNV